MRRAAPFGRVLTAMVTPFDVAGALDLDAAAELATYLVDEQRNDGLVDQRHGRRVADDHATPRRPTCVRAVVDAVGDRAHVVAGVGTFDTVHSIHLAEQAAKAGAHGLLVRDAVLLAAAAGGPASQHFRAVADATDLPVLLYDIPAAPASPIATETMIALAAHERIVGGQGRQGRPRRRLAGHRRDRPGLLQRRRRDDPAAARRSAGSASSARPPTSAAAPTRRLIEAFERGDVAEALRLHRQLLPIYTGIFRTQGTILVKAGLRLRGHRRRAGAACPWSTPPSTRSATCAPTSPPPAC